MLLGDFLFAENAVLQSEINPSALTSVRAESLTGPKVNQSSPVSHAAFPLSDRGHENPSGGIRYRWPACLRE